MRRNVFLSVLLVVTAACESREQRVEIVSQLTVPAQTWVHVPTPEPLRHTGYFADLCIAPAAPVALDRETFGLRTASGTVFAPIFVGVGAGGQADTFAGFGHTQGPGLHWICASPPVGVPLDTPYVQVRLWSAEPFRGDSLFWISTDKK